MTEVASPGHKLGQMIGDFLEEFFAPDLTRLARELGLYLDRKGPRPGVRGTRRKVTWVDNKGNSHDLDYVIEKGGSSERLGQPLAFIEIAWRRYTKHSRNKTGELEGALLPLRETYRSCRMVGAILAGAYTEGGKRQLTSHDITVIHIPFDVLADAFRTGGIGLDYPETAPPETKRAVIERWELLGNKGIKRIKNRLRRLIEEDYSGFTSNLRKALSRKVKQVTLLPLYGTEMSFSSIAEAVGAVSGFAEQASAVYEFVKFEVRVRFTDGDEIEGAFHGARDALQFLMMFE